MSEVNSPVQVAVFLRSCFHNITAAAERFTTISVNRVTTHTGLPKNQFPDSSTSEAELSLQRSRVRCQLMAYRHLYDLIFLKCS